MLPRSVVIMGRCDFIRWLPHGGDQVRTLQLWRPFVTDKSGHTLWSLRAGSIREVPVDGNRGGRMFHRWNGYQPDRAYRVRVTGLHARPRVLGLVWQVAYTYYGRRKYSRRSPPGEKRRHSFERPLPVLLDLGGGNYAIAGGGFKVRPEGIIG